MYKLTSLALAAVLVSLAGCKHNVPIQNVDNQIMPDRARSMSYKEIGDTISQAIQRRGFYCTRTGENKLLCTKDARGQQAKVEIIFTRHEFAIHHVSSTNLKEENGTVNPRYNKWISNLKKDIMAAIARK